MLAAQIAAMMVAHHGALGILLTLLALSFALGMARYGAMLNRTASATLPVGSVAADATTPRRTRWYFMTFGSEATPGDFAFLWTMQAITAAGTSTAVTAQPLDTADAAALSDVGENHTVDVTGTGTEPLAIPLNQRSTYQWYAPPYGELVGPATAGDGYAIRTPTAGALVAVTVGVNFIEE